MSLCHWETAYKYFRGWISSDRPTCDLSPHLLKSLWAPDNVLHSLILLPTYFQQKLCHMSCPNLVWLLWWWSGFIRLRCLFAEELRAQTKTWLTCWPVRMEEPYSVNVLCLWSDVLCMNAAAMDESLVSGLLLGWQVLYDGWLIPTLHWPWILWVPVITIPVYSDRDRQWKSQRDGRPVIA